ncbi:MAG: amino acid deaminase/aldolase [Solirubrobacterales bacterium]
MATQASEPATAPSSADPYARYESIFESVTAPFAFVDLDAMWANAADLRRMAAGVPIRVASKSVRCRALLRRILERDPGFRGLLTFTLPETLWLAGEGFENLVLAYPTADREALTELARLTGDDPAGAPAVMVDSAAHLDLIESAAGDAPVRVCIELDVGWWALGGRIKVGPKRSPVRTPEATAALAREIAARRGMRLVGLTAYEGHIAGVGDDAPSSRVRNIAIRVMQRLSAREIRSRRAAVVDAVSRVTPLELVNGGGTGSLAATASEDAVTEVTAGSGFYDSVLFDHYRSLDLRPAAAFAMPVVRKPSPRIATVLGGGYLASGAPGKDRLPEPYLPRGLRLDPLEGAGEVQTPVLGEPAARLGLGDRVYFRHAKAGELCERFASLHLVEGGRIVDEVPTYRGEGKCFL